MERAGPSDRGDDQTGPAGEGFVRGLFGAHWVGLCRLAGLILGDFAAAEEVVQEAFMKTCGTPSAAARLAQLDRSDLYLRTAVVNLCRSRLRRRSVEARVNAITFRRSEADTAGVSGRPEPDEAKRVTAAVRSLPPRQRAAVVLRYYEDLPEADIARTLGCSVGTVKSQLAKARASLARLLGEERTTDG
ncbi:MAG TPA: sigma-70 family RNA polymerase sigma factor [Acidimicrobiales bacterium]|nr:sigma-70 family RNA polymerase sigma factor [Acidimicrobiales bacterium]